MNNKHALPAVAGECSRLTGLPAPKGAYLRLWQAAAAGILPAERCGGRLLVADEHMHIAIQILGMPRAAETAEAAA